MASVITTDYNYWDVAQTDSDCNGANDVTTGLSLNDGYDFTLYGYNNQPLATVFAPVTGDPVIGVGVTITELSEDYAQASRSSPTSATCRKSTVLKSS